MIEISINIKAENSEAVLDILKNLNEAIQSTEWNTPVDLSLEITQADGDSSLLIVNDSRKYHGVKINCCGQ
jgi:hypothetical protein